MRTDVTQLPPHIRQRLRDSGQLPTQPPLASSLLDDDGRGRLSFFLPMIPPTVTAQQKGASGYIYNGEAVVRHYTKTNVKRTRKMLAMALAPHAPATPLDGALRLQMRWHWPWRKSERKSVVAQGRAWKITKPDSSNIVKLVEDVMTEVGFWHDDNQIASLLVEKFWSGNPGIQIEIEVLT